MLETISDHMVKFIGTITLTTILTTYYKLRISSDYKKLQQSFSDLSRDVQFFEILANNLFVKQRTKVDHELGLSQPNASGSFYTSHLERVASRFISLDESADKVLKHQTDFESNIGFHFDPIFDWVMEVCKVAEHSISSGRDSARFLNRDLAPNLINDIMVEKHGQIWKQVTHKGSVSYQSLMGTKRPLLDRLRRRLFIWYLWSLKPW